MHLVLLLAIPDNNWTEVQVKVSGYALYFHWIMPNWGIDVVESGLVAFSA